MHVFIAYPREFEEDLIGHGFDTFLDIKEITPSELWKVKIEAHIKKAGVFIILYDPTAAKQERYFRVELERIEEERKRNVKTIITVIFPPTKLKQLPPHLSCYQVIEAATNGPTDTGSDDYWIDKAVRELERIRRRKVIFLVTAIITLAGMVMAPLLYQKLNEPTLSESTCKSLLGYYRLETPYVYIDEQDIRATSHDASWEARNCESGKQEGTFILKGDDITRQKIEIKLNNKYEHIADAINKHPSEVTIGRDGRLVTRTVGYPVDREPKITEKGLDGQIWKTHEDDIRQKLNQYKDIATKRYSDAAKTMRCIATLGRNEGKSDVIASICPRYIRVMEKKGQ